MVKKLLVLGILVLLVVGSTFALEVTSTTLTINTKPNHDLSIKITNSENGNKVQSLTKNSGDSGIVDVIISSIGAKELDIEIELVKDYTKITSETFGPYPIKTPITINIGLESSELVEEVVEEPVEEETTESNDVVTGQVVAEKDEGGSIFSKTVLLIVGLVIIIGFVGFFGVRFFMHRGVPSSFVVRKQSEILKEKKDALENVKVEDVKNDNKKIKELEEKMKDIQAEMNKIKNEDKIKQVEKRIQEEQEKLERLRRGEE